MKTETIYIFDHNENKEFKIVGLDKFIEWLNDNNYSFSFSTEGFTFEKRSA
jgi:hypothetical protein